MIQRISYYTAEGTNPYQNIALEEYLLQHVKPGNCILYLWQNKNTVVIGRNQNCWKECKIEELERDGGLLARRLSGGGAVYHDLGNLNFTFLVSERDYDVDRQLEVIIKACSLLGMQAEKTGRNDIVIDGRKFSGNAFYKTEGRCYHHGTILLHADMEKLSRYLCVSSDKLKAKGVSSVKSRVMNLCHFCPDITVEQMKEKLIQAFEIVYSLPAEEIKGASFCFEEWKARTAFFASDQWKYGKHLPFSFEVEKRFEWGNIELLLEVKKGLIENAGVYSDAMDETFLLKIPEALEKSPFQQKAMRGRLSRIPTENIWQSQMIKDTIELLMDQEL